MKIRSFIYWDPAKNEPGSAVIEMTGKEIVILNNIIWEAAKGERGKIWISGYGEILNLTERSCTAWGP